MIKQILRPFVAADSNEELWFIDRFIDEHLFLTLTGHVGIAYQIHAPDIGGLDALEIDSAAEAMTKAVRLLDPQIRVYHYVIRSKSRDIQAGEYAGLAQPAVQVRLDALNAADRYDVDLYLVLFYEDAQAGSPALRLYGQRLFYPIRWWQLLSPQRVVHLHQSIIDAAAALLRTHAAMFEDMTKDVLGLERLPATECFAFLCRLVSYTAPHVALKPLISVREQMAREKLDYFNTHLEVGPKFVKVLTMKDPPGRTRSQLLAQLHAIPNGTFIVCSEWKRLDVQAFQSLVDSLRRHWSQRHVRSSHLLDGVAKSRADELDQLLLAIDKDGCLPGMVSLSVVVVADTLKEVSTIKDRIWNVLARHDGAFLDETTPVRAWGAIVPGSSVLNRRYLQLLDVNYADLCLLFGLDRGDERQAVITLETPEQVPYHVQLSPNGDDTRHTLFLGATGSGKSTLLNATLTHLQKFGVNAFVQDVGGSFVKLAAYLGGGVVELGTETSTARINPFSLAPTKDNVNFLHEFISLLMQGKDFEFTRTTREILFSAIEEVYAVRDAKRRRLKTLAWLLNSTIPHRLDDWIEGGRYGSVFDNAIDTLDTVAAGRSQGIFTVFDYQKLEAFPALIEPLQVYTLNWMKKFLNPARLTICVMDELALLLKMPAMRRHVELAMPGWRKANGAMFLSTQHVEDLERDGVLQKIVESCMTTYFLANKQRDPEVYRRVFGMNEAQLSALAGLERKKQVLIYRRGLLTKVCNVNLTPWELDLYSNSVADLRSDTEGALV